MPTSKPFVISGVSDEFGTRGRVPTGGTNEYPDWGADRRYIVSSPYGVDSGVSIHHDPRTTAD